MSAASNQISLFLTSRVWRLLCDVVTNICILQPRSGCHATLLYDRKCTILHLKVFLKNRKDKKKGLEVVRRSLDLKFWLQILTQDPDSRSWLEILTRRIGVFHKMNFFAFSWIFILCAFRLEKGYQSYGQYSVLDGFFRCCFVQTEMYRTAFFRFWAIYISVHYGFCLHDIEPLQG